VGRFRRKGGRGISQKGGQKNKSRKQGEDSQTLERKIQRRVQGGPWKGGPAPQRLDGDLFKKKGLKSKNGRQRSESVIPRIHGTEQQKKTTRPNQRLREKQYS